MGTTNVTLTEATFIHGVLYPAGVTLPVDLDSIGLSSVDDTMKAEKAAKTPAVPLAPNLVKAGNGATLEEVEVAAIAPTGPNPTAPQAKPAGTVQQGEAFIAPGEDGGAGSALTPES